MLKQQWDKKVDQGMKAVWNHRVKVMIHKVRSINTRKEPHFFTNLAQIIIREQTKQDLYLNHRNNLQGPKSIDKDKIFQKEIAIQTQQVFQDYLGQH